jgi:WD40 repeat protein
VGPVLPILMTLRKHHKGSAIRKVIFGDDSLLFTAAKTVKIHDVESGKTIRRIGTTATESRVYSMCVIDKYLLATGDDSGVFRLWDYRTSRGVAMELKEFDDYISDLDVQSDKRLVLASSGDGTIAAFNVRAKRMEPPQSELFEAGFNCILSLDARNKVLAGSDEGVINIFNKNQLGNISDRYPIDSDVSIERMLALGDSLVAVGCSDGKTLLVNILPNKVVKEIFTHDLPVESLSVQRSTNTIASLDSNVVKVARFEEKEEPDSDASDDSDGDDEDKPASQEQGFFSDL